MPRVRRIRWDQLEPRDEARWRTLAGAQVPLGNAFLSPTFTKAAGEAYGRVEICLIEEADRLLAIFPFQFRSPLSALLRAAERVGEEMNDYFGVIATQGAQYAPRDLLRSAALNHFYFTHLGEEQTAFGLTGSRTDGGLRIALNGQRGAYWDHLKQIDKKFASDTERRERKAQEANGPLRFIFSEPDREQWLRMLLTEKRRQYLETGKGDWLGIRARERLVRSLAHSEHEECAGVVSTLHFGDTWAAIHFGLKSRRTLHYWLPVYNPALSSFAPGRLLLRQIVLQAEGLGLDLIDRGAGESRAKSDFPSVRRGYYSGVWRMPGPSAWMYSAIQSAQWRMQAYRASKAMSGHKISSAPELS